MLISKKNVQRTDDGGKGEEESDVNWNENSPSLSLSPPLSPFPPNATSIGKNRTAVQYSSVPCITEYVQYTILLSSAPKKFDSALIPSELPVQVKCQV